MGQAIRTVHEDELESIVRDSSESMALDFYQSTCAPCHALEPRLLRVARMFLGRLALYRVDVASGMKVAKRFQVTSIPTVFVLVHGKELARLDGRITEQQLVEAFDRATLVIG